MDGCRYCIIVVFLVLLGGVHAQSQRNAKLFSDGDESRILKANSYISQGNEILFANFSYPKDSLFQRPQNYIELSKNLYAGKRISRLLFETKDYYRTGFDGTIDVYKKYIHQYLMDETRQRYSKVNALCDSVDVCVDRAERMRSKSQVIASLKEGGAQIHASNIQYQEAVFFCERALNLMAKDLALKNQLKVKKNIGEGSDIEAVDEVSSVEREKDSTLSVGPEKESELVEPVLKKEVKKVSADTLENIGQREHSAENIREPVLSEIKVYYTVQIMADKVPVSATRIQQVYSGKYPIVENEGDGWYRYSFGSFATLKEAKIALSQSNTKGYIVAYKEKERISLDDAKNWLGTNGR